MRDLIILGGGMSAMSAAVYASRKKLNFVVLAKEIGGQIALQPEVENYPGFLEKEGLKLISNMKTQAEREGVEVKEFFEAKSIKKEDAEGKDIFVVESATGEKETAKSILIAVGKKPRKLGVPGEAEFENKGVTYCATCDAPLFGGKKVAVVGGGNSAFEAALQLTEYAEKIYILIRSEKTRADEAFIEKAKNSPKVEIMYNTAITEIKGDQFVNKALIKNMETDEESELDIEGVFVEIGQIPNTDFLKDFVELNEIREIIINPKTNETNIEGVYAAGDATDVLEKQAVVAAGEGAKALLQIYKWLTKSL